MAQKYANKSSSSAEPYIQSLDITALKRYQTKIADINGADPYQLPKEAFTSDHSELPCVKNEDIVAYLVFGTSLYTMTQFKSMKSLHAHNQVTSGWVFDLKTHVPINSPNRLVTGKVYHSQRMNEKPTQPWIISDSEGNVLSAHCTCVAGLGETCCHVAAILFTIDTANRIKDNKTVTDTTPYWGLPSFKEVAYAEGSSIDFTSASSRKRQLDSAVQNSGNIPKRKKARPDISFPTEGELNQFFDAIQVRNSGVKPAILSVTRNYADEYIDKTDKLAPKLSNLYDESCCSLPYAKIQEKCNDIFESGYLSVSKEQCEAVEKRTRSQAASSLWFELRAGRVTASKLHQVCHTNPAQPSLSLLMNVCKPAKLQKPTEAMKWGVDHEATARTCYEKEQIKAHPGFKVKQSGLMLNPDYPFMAASPDGLCECTCCQQGCVEIKCPFSARHMIVKDAISLPNFPLHMVDGKITLKTTHAYYSQIQCQMFLSNVSFCDFVLWTERDLFTERIFQNREFWQNALIKALAFFKAAILPQLLCEFFTSLPPVTVRNTELSSTNKQSGSLSLPDKPAPLTVSVTDEQSNSPPVSDQELEKWCHCKQGERNEMIACDNENCAIVWFHFDCVGIRCAPKGEWFCPDCRKLPQFKRSGKNKPKKKC